MEKCQPEDVKVELENASFTWKVPSKENPEEPPIINKLSLSLRPSDLVVVVGPVGGGKTTLLYSLLEETL